MATNGVPPGNTTNGEHHSLTNGATKASVNGDAEVDGDAASKEKPASEFGVHPDGPYVGPKLQLEDRYIDEPRSLKVAVVGGGLAGITAGVLLPAKVPNINLVIYEKNADLGGTWYENTYPGVRCDIPGHVYQSSFSPKTQWSEKFPQGKEICDYWQDLARKYDVYKHVKLQHEVTEAEWNSAKGKWIIHVHNHESGQTAQDEADFLVSAIGRFNAWNIPDWPGLDKYQGYLRHVSNWDPAFDATGKRVALIGNGASGLQLLPGLQAIASRVDHYVRSKTWIATSWAGDERSTEPQLFTEEELENFKNPEYYLKFRKELEGKYWRRLDSYLKNTTASIEARKLFTEVIHKRLAKKPEIAEDFIPDFSPSCRRLTPGPGYLEALCEDNVDYIRTPIARFTETGIETSDGKLREVDAVFCATGANASMAPPFSIRANGIDLSQAWQKDGEYGFPYTYMGVAAPKFPNLLFVMGPHGAGISGTVPHETETGVTYLAKLLRKVSSEGIRTITPSVQATNEFLEYSDAFFKKTVLSEPCSSWYKGHPAGRIHGLWPGSAAQQSHVRSAPRWEDYEYEYLKTGNRFQWYFGNGRTRKEGDEESDMTAYLQMGEVDLRDVHESWWNVA